MTSPANVDLTGDAGRAGMPGYSGETVWSSRTQWGAIFAGAFGGIVCVMVMATLGAALGITVGAISVSSTQTVNADTAEKGATAFTIGTAIWVLLTALVTGLVGGWVLNSTSRRDRPYSSLIFGGITWAVGNCIMLAVASPALGGTVAGIGSSAAAAVSGKQPDSVTRMMPRTTKESQNAPAARSESAPGKTQQPMTDEEKVVAKDAAEKAAAAASGAAWVLLGSQLISLAATIFAAGWNRHTGARVVTEFRPRPAPTA